MKTGSQGQLLRIFVGETDKVDGKPLYEQIVLEARRLNLAGATVLRGIMGYGANSRLHTAKILRLSEDMPMIIEIVDKDENIARIMAYLDTHVKEGLITLENVNVIKYTAGDKGL
jgi:PII-like signaling protein